MEKTFVTGIPPIPGKMCSADGMTYLGTVGGRHYCSDPLGSFYRFSLGCGEKRYVPLRNSQVPMVFRYGLPPNWDEGWVII